MRVLVVHNEVCADSGPDEADVLVQVAAVRAALEERGHTVSTAACNLDISALLQSTGGFRPEAIFNLVESLDGKGSLISLVPLTLEAAGLRCAGCPGEAIHLTTHKPLAKRLMQESGLPTPAWATGGTFDDDRPWPGPWIVKPALEDASLGLDDQSLVEGDRPRVRDLLKGRSGRPGGPWFAEAFIEGREFNIALLDGPAGPVVLPCAEMIFAEYPDGKPRILGYAAKWDPDSFEYIHTTRTFDLPLGDSDLLEELRRLSLACWDLFGLRGWARVDFRVDQDGKPWILEVNANPCLSPDAGFAAALACAGIPFSEAVERILTSSR
ncbi:D-alanine--D-alanine ligase [bacterium CG_4_9_14_3_um_filter_65_15]|nr:MAG: D-alanine--D-alanine ligase [bacterium CG_4_9_14_3_um_filter_65_15]